MNYPLGRTAGRPNQPGEQREIVSAALSLLHDAVESGEIVPLPYVWPEPWKQRSRRRGDTRTERHDTPQWERPEDATAAGART